jgi:hypothetical protein
MKRLISFAIAALALTSCTENADPGPIQEQEKDYTITDFDRLEMTAALNVTVVEGSEYSVKVRGDRRDIDDLEVNMTGSKLRMSFKTPGHGYNRQYTTFVMITMPSLNGVSYSGAVTSNISGFSSDAGLDVNLSGASKLNISGTVVDLQAVASGASELNAFDLQTSTATVEASGASKIKVQTTQKLNANASGASEIKYRGTPELHVSVSGASEVGAG